MKQTWRSKHKLAVVVDPLAEKGVSPLQEKFCRIYATDDCTQTEAARRAGYSEDHASGTACHLMKRPEILARIQEIKEELADVYAVTFEGHVRKLAQIRDMAMEAGQFAPAIQAERSRGQVAGFYIDRKEILMGKIDQMSRDEVMKEILRLQSEYPHLTGVASPMLELKAEAVVDIPEPVIERVTPPVVIPKEVKPQVEGRLKGYVRSTLKRRLRYLKTSRPGSEEVAEIEAKLQKHESVRGVNEKEARATPVGRIEQAHQGLSGLDEG